MAQVIISLPCLLLSKYQIWIFEGSGFLGHSPEVRLSLLDLNHVSSLKGMVIRGGGAIQCQNNYLQAMWTQVSNRYISLRGTFMVRIILEYRTFGIAQFPNAFCTGVL